MEGQVEMLNVNSVIEIVKTTAATHHYSFAVAILVKSCDSIFGYSRVTFGETF